MPVFEQTKVIIPDDFKEIYKSAELIVTIPSITSSVEQSFSAQKMYITHLLQMYTKPRPDECLSVISIEKDFYYNEIIE